jgi:hypothetical protein
MTRQLLLFRQAFVERDLVLTNPTLAIVADDAGWAALAGLTLIIDAGDRRW